ncbi:MAG: 40S ribosomal protein S19 [Nanoarchaeota archaeon]|nr:40S ribosomal protein S19 [Nanoarchaeota archaeon]
MAEYSITPYDIESGKFNSVLKEKLKQIPELQMPEWAKFVKTGAGKVRPPMELDWWQSRAASILHQLYTQGLVGVSKLRTRYGGKMDRGVKPSIFFRASGKIIRVILQQAEKAGLVEKFKDKKAGRRLTKKGKLFLDEVAVQVHKGAN